MPDYQFYQDVFCGSLIPQDKFRSRIQRAKDALEGMEMRFTVVPYGENSRKMALCAIAETLHSWEKTGQYEAVSIGGVTVRYEKERRSLNRSILQSVQGYLEIYRGVG